MPTPSAKLRDRWLEVLLPLVPDMGWTEGSADHAAREAGLSAGEQALAAPNGAIDLIDHFFDGAADKMLEGLATRDLTVLRTHERVAAGVRTWLDTLEPHKEAVRKASGRGLMPWGASAAAKRVWATADVIWEAAGDTATDYNRQTKRALLSAVMPPIVLYWLDNDDSEALDMFIASKLQTAMRVGQSGSALLKPILDFSGRFLSGQKPRNL